MTGLLLPVRRLNEHAVLPHRGYHDDAGLDLPVLGGVWVPPGVTADVPCGLAIQLPQGTFGLIVGRSSTRRNRGLLVHPGIIDVGWRGDLFALVENLTDEVVQIGEGERLAQLIILPNLTSMYAPEWVDELDPHDRGTNGFGSTGR